MAFTERTKNGTGAVDVTFRSAAPVPNLRLYSSIDVATREAIFSRSHCASSAMGAKVPSKK
jgi:hypothetical protein